MLEECSKTNVYPCAIPNWDNTPRSGHRGVVLHGSTPGLFRKHLRDLLEQVRPKPAEHRVLFIKSWNEWAEGNHLEPDLKFGSHICAYCAKKYQRLLVRISQRKTYQILPEKITASSWSLLSTLL